MKAYTIIGVAGILLTLSLFLSYNFSTKDAQGIEWTPSPYESVDEHMGLVKPIIEENESRIETN